MNGTDCDPIRWKRCGVGLCFEVAQDGEEVLIRDSRVPGKVVRITQESWDAFIQGIKRGEYDQF